MSTPIFLDIPTYSGQVVRVLDGGQVKTGTYDAGHNTWWETKT